VLATVFFVCTLLLAYVSNAKPASTGGSVLENPAVTAPVVPETASQIPGTAPAAVTPATEPAAPGPAQIPSR
jgi:preprotein translocase subunit SecG